MRYTIAILLFLIWLVIAPWIAIGYGELHLPTPLTDHPTDLAFFYLLPLASLGIAVSTYRWKRAK